MHRTIGRDGRSTADRPDRLQTTGTRPDSDVHDRTDLERSEP
ncbi:hypothetical protein [Natronorubrum thiooxidans]|nr:hypothetical protein [Natronorubrum thiooxidans]